MVFKENLLAVVAAAIVVMVVGAYFANLCLPSDVICHLSNQTDVWGQFGDYVGGLLNPALSFLSIVLLLRSLALQRESNSDLKKELLNSEKSEKMRAFDSLFFSMIDSQKKMLSELTLNIGVGKPKTYVGVPAIFKLEIELQKFSQNKQLISGYIDSLDSNDQIYGISRAFYITVRIITDNLSNTNGFKSEDRKDRLLTLVNFTDFAQLRLVLISMKYLDFYSSEYLNNHIEFKEVLSEIALDFDQI